MQRSHRPLQTALFLASGLLLGCTTLLTSGCLAVAAGAGAGTVAYVRGDLQSTLDGSLSRCTKAADKAITQLKFAKVEENRDALTSVIVARTAEDKRVEIKMTATTSHVVNVSIRVGVFGDSRIATAVLEKIKSNL